MLVARCYSLRFLLVSCFFVFNDTATTEIYTLSLHDALPISNYHRNPHSGKLKVTMKSHTALLPLTVFITFAAAHSSASTPAPSLLGAKSTNPALQTQSLKSTPDAASATGSANPGHLFSVIEI